MNNAERALNISNKTYQYCDIPIHEYGRLEIVKALEAKDKAHKHEIDDLMQMLDGEVEISNSEFKRGAESALIKRDKTHKQEIGLLEIELRHKSELLISCEEALAKRDKRQIEAATHNQKSFTEQLEHYTKIAFDNEKEFFDHCILNHSTSMTLVSIQFSTDEIKEVAINYTTGDGGIDRINIDMDFFIKWADNLES